MPLAINLWPDYGVLAGIVIAAHWFWLFVIRKNQLSPSGAQKGYQTGGDKTHLSLDSPEGKDILSLPDFGPSGFAAAETAVVASRGESAPPPPEPVQTTYSGNATPAENGLPAEKEFDALPAQPSAQSVHEDSIRRKYAEANLTSTLEALAAGQLAPAAIVELESLASLTRKAELICPFAMDKAWKLLLKPVFLAPSTSNQPPNFFQ